MSLSNDVVACGYEFVMSFGDGPGPVLDDIVDHVMSKFADELAADRELQTRDWVRNKLRHGLKRNTEENQTQLYFDGWAIPSAITVPMDEGTTGWVAFENATRAQAHAHMLIKQKNLFNAEREMAKFQGLLDSMDSVWLENPELTAGEVIRIMRERGEMGLDAA